MYNTLINNVKANRPPKKQQFRSSANWEWLTNSTVARGKSILAVYCLFTERQPDIRTK